MTESDDSSCCGACRLCGDEASLRQSHIIPQFVFDWLKETSATGHIRYGRNPNKRVQDGLKIPLLCDNCEQRLGRWEKDFCERVFLPYHKDSTQTLHYDAWLAKFCISVCWRVLVHHTEETGLASLSDELKKNARMACDRWKALLLDQCTSIMPFEQHLLPLDLVVDLGDLDLPPNFNRYILRAVEIDVVSSPVEAFVYAKMCRFIVLGFIRMKHRTDWHDTKVGSTKGCITPGRMTLTPAFLDFVKGRASMTAALQQSLSARQKELIAQTCERDLDRVAQSETFRGMNQDVLLLGDEAFGDILDEETIRKGK